MFGIAMITVILGLVTLLFISMEINWSIQNIEYNWKRFRGISRPIAIILIPFCLMPVILDVVITLGVAFVLGASGMFGMLMSAIVASGIACLLYFKRRKYGWRYL